MPSKYDKLVSDAQAITDEKFRERFSSLTSLSETEIGKVLKSTGISNENLAALLLEIKNATEYNDKLAKSINNIQGGVQALVAITKKLLL